MADVYRKAASIVVLRLAESGSPGSPSHQVLLLHKPRKRDAWQLPQGGIEEGETTLEAALRELQEEASITGCRVLGTSQSVYQYDFPPSYRHFRPDNVKGQHIEYVFAQAPDDATVQVDRKEVDGFVWVDFADLSSYIKRGQYLGLVSELCREAVTLATGKKAEH